MANYYSDHPEIGFYLNHPLMARIVELKEKGFADAKETDSAHRWYAGFWYYHQRQL